MTTFVFNIVVGNVFRIVVGIEKGEYIMGVGIHLAISKSVTREEWKHAYQETLLLLRAFPLGERRKVSVRGIPTICMVPTKEREEKYGWNNENTRTGWFADGDYEYLRVAEDYYLPRDIVIEDQYEKMHRMRWLT